jgi:hypothetical protein
MFGTIRKHQTWLWVFLVGVMSLGLVFFFTPSAYTDRGGGSRAEGENGSINGKPITQADYYDAFKEIRIASFLHTGKWPGKDDSDERLSGETVARVFMVKKLKEMGIEASDRAVGLMVHEQLKDYPYETLAKEILEPNSLTLADYERYVRNEAGIRQLISAASVTARLVTPTEAEAIWRKQNQEVAGQLACFWATNYLSKVAITNGAISNFYNNSVSSYKIPERLILSYVAFPASNYLAEADNRLSKITNLNEIVSDHYFRGSRTGTNAWTDTNGVPLSEAAAKEKIKEEIRQNEALITARRAATDFGTELISQTNANDFANLERLATNKSLRVQVTAPFVARQFGSWTNGLEEFDNEPPPGARADETGPETLRDLIRQKAVTLADDRPIQFSPILGRHGAYIIARKGKLPSEFQPLEKILDKVTTDYKNFSALDMARKAALAFHTNLTNGLTLKKPFAELCAAESVPVISLPPFSPVTTALTNADPRVNLRSLQGVAENLEVGHASRFLSAQPGTEGGYIFYLASRPPIDQAKLNEELPEFVNRMRVMRQNEAFQQWFRKQADQGKLTGRKREASVSSQN